MSASLVIEKAAKYLGTRLSVVLDRKPFCDWRYERESDEDRTSYISFTGRGVELHCDRSEMVTSIYIHASSDAAKEFNVATSLTRSEVRDRLGEPSASGEGQTLQILGDYGPYDRFDYPDYSAHYQFHSDRDCIKLLTLMAPHIVPAAGSGAEKSTDAEDTVLVIIPSLVAQLLHAERENGAPLSETEVLRIRDDSEYVVIRPDDLSAIIERRGYEDIDPERCWEQWQQARIELGCGELLHEKGRTS